MLIESICAPDVTSGGYVGGKQPAMNVGGKLPAEYVGGIVCLLTCVWDVDLPGMCVGFGNRGRT